MFMTKINGFVASKIVGAGDNNNVEMIDWRRRRYCQLPEVSSATFRREEYVIDSS